MSRLRSHCLAKIMTIKHLVFSDVIKALAILLISTVFQFSYALSEAELASDKDKAAYEVLGKSSLPPGYAEGLLSQFQNEQEGLIWRNYILQKLDLLYLHEDGSG